MHKCVNNTVGNIYHLEQWVDNFFPYSQKQLRFDQPVSIVFQSDEENASRMLGKTAYYDPKSMQVVLYTDNRHPKDIMRSLSHELVHHAQNCRGDFKAESGMETGYAQNDPHLRKMEREAYTKGNLIFRDFEDLIKTGKINIEIDFSDSGEPKMSLKEWKNNEINTKLMKKWGFLKEGRYEDGLASFMKDPSNLGFAGNHGGESCADVHPEDTAKAGGDPTKGHGDWQKRGGFEEWKAAQDLKETIKTADDEIIGEEWAQGQPAGGPLGNSPAYDRENVPCDALGNKRPDWVGKKRARTLAKPCPERDSDGNRVEEGCGGAYRDDDEEELEEGEWMNRLGDDLRGAVFLKPKHKDVYGDPLRSGMKADQCPSCGEKLPKIAGQLQPHKDHSRGQLKRQTRYRVAGGQPGGGGARDLAGTMQRPAPGSRSASGVFGAQRENQQISVIEAKEITRRIIERIKLENK